MHLLAEFDKCDGPRCPWNLATDTAKCLHLLHGWLFAICGRTANLGGRARVVLLCSIQSCLVVGILVDAGPASLSHHEHVLIERGAHGY